MPPPPGNAQPDDVALDQGIWYVFSQGQWVPFDPHVQDYMNRAYTGVSGTGDNQVFAQAGVAEPPVPRSQVLQSVMALQPGSSQPAPSPAGTSAGPQGERIADAYCTWTNDPNCVWPPMKEDITSPKFVNNQFAGYNTIQDTEAIKQFLSYAKLNNLRFTDASLPGVGAPQAVDIGGQKYFQQPGPDGQFERIPEPKATAAAPAIETHGGIQFINQDGKLVPIDNMMKKMKENFVVTGDFEGAAAVHAWETRPSNQEYFDRMLQYVNAPADQLLISAIARGQGLVAPPPAETIQRIGPQPEYLTEAFNMLRDQMQMGQPGEGETAQSIMEQRFQEREDQAAKREDEAKQIANETARFQLESSRVQAEREDEAKQIANETARFQLESSRVTGEMDLRDRLSLDPGGDPRDIAIGGTPTGDDVLDPGGDPRDFSFAGALARGQRPQMAEYNDIAAKFAETGFRFGDVRGISREDMAGFINSLSPEQRALAENQFKDQGGLANAGAFFDSVAGLENALNFHLEARGMDTVDLDNSGDDEVSETGGEVISTTGTKVITDKSTAATRTVDVGEEGVDAAVGDIGPDEEMTREEIFAKYPFLAPADVTDDYAPTEGRSFADMVEAARVRDLGRRDPQGPYGMDIPTGRDPQGPYGMDIPTGRDPAGVQGPYGMDIPTGRDPAGVGQYGGLPTGIPLYGMDIPTRTGGFDFPETPQVPFPYAPTAFELAASTPIDYSAEGGVDSPFVEREIARNVPTGPAYIPTALEAAASTPIDYAAEGGMGDIDPTFERDLALRQTEVPVAPVVRGPDVAPVQAPITGVGQYGGLPAAAGSGLDVQGAYGVDARPAKLGLDIEPDEPDYYGAEGAYQQIVPDIAEQMYAPFEFEESAPITPIQHELAPWEEVSAPVQEFAPVEIFEEDMGFVWSDPEPVVEDFAGTGASEAAYWSDYGEGARGTRTDDRFTLVGEEGPELALFPRGTEIIPLNRPAKPKQRRRLRNSFADSIDSFAFGGFSSGGPALVGEMGPEVVDLPPGAQVMPAGVSEMMTGRPTRQPRSLFRQAGMRAPSAQTIANLLPEEIEVYQEMGRLAGIPEKAFEREFRSMVPMGQGGTRQARFAPRRTGRTRYGST